jgi:hypothetical protein
MLERAEAPPQEDDSTREPEAPATGYYGGLTRLDTSFDNLAEARFEMVRAKFRTRGREGEEARARYLDTRSEFEWAHGSLDHEYWTSSAPGGVAVTHDRFRVRRPFRRRRAHFHRFTDYVCRRFPQVDEHLFAGDALAAICEEVLRGPTQRIALTQIYTAASQLLSTVDAIGSSESEPAPKSELDADDPAVRKRLEENRRRRENDETERKKRLRLACIGYHKALRRAERFYRDGASQSAQYYYFIGMLLGAVFVASLVFGFTLILPWIVDRWGLDLSGAERAAGFTAAVAGALGASVSVMWRMTAGTFQDDAVFGADNLKRLGAFRPFLGAMFGLILYVALQAGMIAETYIPDNPGWHFYIFLAFLAGFSERLVPDFLGEREKGLVPRTDEQEASNVAVDAEDTDQIPAAPMIRA